MKAKTGAIASLVLFALAGCRDHHPLVPVPPPAPPTTAVRLPEFLLPSSLQPLTGCTFNGEPATVVRIVIPRDFIAADKNTQVRQKVDTGLVGEDDEDAWDASPKNRKLDTTTDYTENPYSLDLRTTGVASGEWVKIKVILKNKAYRFYDHAGVSAIRGVAADSTLNGDWLCQKRKAFDETDKNKLNVLIFYAKRRPGVYEGLVNYIIEPDNKNGSGATGGYDTRIIIDPRIRNEG